MLHNPTLEDWGGGDDQFRWKPMERPFCGPRISTHAFSTRWRLLWIPHFWSMRSHSMVQLVFLFIEILIFRKRLGVATYFNFFLKGKQNKKENP